MIFHASIPADEPQRVAEVIAEIWNGEAFRFPPWPGAYVAMAGDARSSTVEVYPRANTITPGDGVPMPREAATTDRFSAFHLAVATPRSAEEIFAIAEREGWRVQRCSRGGFFDVIEVWLENALLVEVLTEEMQRDYQANVNLNTWRWTKAQAAA
ncbi:MAG: hypothetical protein ACXU8N_06910 [Telluria sp.]